MPERLSRAQRISRYGWAAVFTCDRSPQACDPSPFPTFHLFRRSPRP